MYSHLMALSTHEIFVSLIPSSGLDTFDESSDLVRDLYTSKKCRQLLLRCFYDKIYII